MKSGETLLQVFFEHANPWFTKNCYIQISLFKNWFNYINVTVSVWNKKTCNTDQLLKRKDQYLHEVS